MLSKGPLKLLPHIPCSCINISKFGIMENHKISWKNHGILLSGDFMNPTIFQPLGIHVENHLYEPKSLVSFSPLLLEIQHGF